MLTPSSALSRFRLPGALPALLACAGLALFAVACGDGGEDGSQPDYRGRASDENFHALQESLATEDPVADPDKAAALDEPGDPVSADEIPTFTWTNPDTNAPDVSGGCLNQPALSVYTGLQTEHCPVVTGYVYWLQLDLPDQPDFMGALTTNTSWTPDADTWALIAARPGTVTGRLLTAYMVADDIDKGPYTSPVSITIE